MYYELYRKLSVESVRYSDRFARRIREGYCKRCKTVQFDLTKCEFIEIDYKPPDILANWTDYPNVDASWPILREDVIAALNKIKSINQIVLKDLRLRDGSSVEGFKFCVPKYRIQRRGDGIARHGFCPACNVFYYSAELKNYIMRRDIRDEPKIGHDRGYLSIFHEDLLAEFSPRQRRRMVIKQLKIIDRPLDNLTTELSDYPTKAWIKRYLKCRGNAAGNRSCRSNEMIAAME